MLKIALIVVGLIAVGIACVLIVAVFRPDQFTVQRTVSIKASPEKIFPFIDDFRKWPVWSPFENIDPDMKRTYGPKTAGEGATYGWEGNKNIGSGSMEILAAPPPQRVSIKLDFTKPFEAHNIAEFTLVPAGDSTNVTWAMRGPVPYLFRIVHMVMNMDKMVGGQFDKGLADLKAAVEK